MNESVFEGFLDSKEYYKLWFNKRKSLFLLYIFLQIFNLLFAIIFAISFVLNSNAMLIMRYVSITICLLLSISLGITWYLTFTTGGIFPRGETKVFKTSTDTIRIEWNYKKKNFVKLLTINKKEILMDHLYLEENRKNFVFLPKDTNV